MGLSESSCCVGLGGSNRVLGRSLFIAFVSRGGSRQSRALDAGHPRRAPFRLLFSAHTHTRSPRLSSLPHVQGRFTPLHHAAAEGHTATAALLVEKGADVDAIDGVRSDCVDVYACC